MPSPSSAHAFKRVLVLSYANAANFGDRLGYHLLNAVLPPHAEVTQAYFKPWTAPPEGEFDLLVLGIGNSLFGPLLSDKLLALLDRVPRKVGIFGTQYPHSLDRARLSAVVDRLDHWFARYEQDVDMYGGGRANVSHLGDWLIDAFPMARGTDARLLRIGDEMWKKGLALDRVIQNIQRHRSVYSTRLHPLLCAFTSAEEVAFEEQREDGSGQSSGKFGALCRDVFGCEFEEKKFWEVDRSAVLAYKTRVRGNMTRLAQWLDAALPPL